jgi:hypothetical protein
MQIRLIIAPSSPHLSRINAAVSLINGCQRYYRLELSQDSALGHGGPIRPAEFCTAWRSVNDGPASILVTEAPLVDNWFSHEYRDCSIITIGDWEQVYAPPSLRSYLIYEIAQSLIHFAADMSEEMAMNMVHEPAVGCIYDMTINKPDIKYGMIAGNICANCVARLRALGIKADAIDALLRILDVVRSEALGIPVVLDPDEVFVVMRFSSNDENDNAWRYGIKSGVEQCGLKVARADSRIESGQILNKVQNHIARSRLVIAKVDHDNLNVFFELGLAMGMKKDVLLISESTLVLSLPSDLRNWECLTYDKGNYPELAERLTQYLASAYGLGQAFETSYSA